MPDAPSNTELRRLQLAINWSYKQLKPFRHNDMTAMQQYVGRHYSDNGSDMKVPFSLLELAVTTYTQRLSGGKPKALFTTPHSALAQQKAKLQQGTNNLLDEINFGETLTEVIQGGFFSMGITKIGLDFRSQNEAHGFLHDDMQPYADAVCLDNWVHDMTATRWDKVQFCGDRYSVLLEDARQMFDNGAKLKPLADTEGHTQSEERLKEMSQGGNSSNREYYREVGEVWDIWDPRKRQIVTLAAGEGDPADTTGEALHVINYEGPERGPYRLLRFNPVRGNVMPLAPVGLWRDMHDLANNVMRKLDRQARRQKTVYGVQPGGEPDGTVAMQANDGDMVKILNPKSIANLSFPGVEPNQLAFLIQIKNLASWLWGNLDALGGLSPQAETLGQDRLLTASASQRLIRMQNVVIEYVTDVIWSLAELLYNDPYILLPQTKRRGDFQIPSLWTPEDREADFLHYNMELEPYSMQYRSPSERLETIRQIMLQLLVPMQQAMAMQGVFLDYEAIVKLLADYTGLSELNDLVVYADPRHPEEGPQRPLQSPATTRTNVRVNRPGATSQGKDEAMMTALLGGGQQNSQFSQVGRPTG
jgi:hypothetical protein